MCCDKANGDKMMCCAPLKRLYLVPGPMGATGPTGPTGPTGATGIAVLRDQQDLLEQQLQPEVLNPIRIIYMFNLQQLLVGMEVKFHHFKQLNRH